MQVWADAKAECYSSGNAYGCAYAYANAERWAKASVEAYASAWALAINECNCNQKPQDLASYSFGSAYEVWPPCTLATQPALAHSPVCMRVCVRAMPANVLTQGEPALITLLPVTNGCRGALTGAVRRCADGGPGGQGVCHRRG
jgi:hypothetical protein